jgi:VWFA-related protein
VENHAMMRPEKLALFSSVLFLALPALGATPDDKPLPQTPRTSNQTAVPTLKVYSRETIVDILVTDDQGQPVRNLKQSDFTIKEDGKPQYVRSFRELDIDTPTSGRILPKLPTPIRTNYQTAPTGGSLNILLIDALHSNTVYVARALDATSAYLDRMPKGTQLAIFWLSGTGLHLLQGFTSDPSLLQDAAHTDRIDIGTYDDSYAVEWRTIDALNQLAQYVSGVKGRKNLIWFTPGVPVPLMHDGGYGWGGNTYSGVQNTVRTASGVGGSTDSLFFGSEEGIDRAMVYRLMDTYALFTAEQIAISPVDPRGVVGLGMSQLASEEVAADSGGVAFYNSNDLTASLAKAVDEGSHYYTLSYVPPRLKQDGHFHAIDVVVNRPGLHLVYRKGYNAEDPKPQPQFAGPELIKAALEGKTLPATEILFDAKVEPAPSSAIASPEAKSSKKRTPYDLVLAVPQSQISFADAPNGTRKVSLQFSFDAYDLSGKLLGRSSQNVNLALTPEQYQQFIKKPLLFHQQIALYPGPLFLRVGVLDSTSNKVGTLELPLTVPKK